jgi:hypothetical protein
LIICRAHAGVRAWSLRQTVTHWTFPRPFRLDQIRANFLHGKSLPVDQYAGAFQAFGLELNLPDFQLPGIGPLMIVANHPFGGADALSLGMACRAQRPDCLMLGNKLASEFPGIGEVTLPLYIMGQEDAARKNASTLRKALGHLKGGGSLCVFPSGEVAHWRGASVEESPWSHHIASLAPSASHGQRQNRGSTGWKSDLSPGLQGCPC